MITPHQLKLCHVPHVLRLEKHWRASETRNFNERIRGRQELMQKAVSPVPKRAVRMPIRPILEHFNFIVRHGAAM